MPKKEPLIKLIQSIPPKILGGRFLVKASSMDNGVNKQSIMFIVKDLIDNGFAIKYFNTEDNAAEFLKLLNASQ
jgi:hypothetical protein